MVRKMKNKVMLVIAIVLASLIAPALAACTNVCDTNTQYSCSKSVSTLTKGTSSTLTVTITNKQSEAVNSLAAQLQGSWFSASSSTTTISSIQAGGGNANADFSITPTSTGGQDVCVALGSTCTADCGSVTVNSAAELGVTSLSAPSSVQLSSLVLFTVSTTIQNSGTETAGSQSATTATLASSNSNCVVASPTKTIGTISGSSQNSVSWSVSTENEGSCTLTVSTSASPGGSATSSKSVTITAAAVAAAAAAAAGGGGGGAVAGAVEVAGTKVISDAGKSTITVPEIKAGTAALIKIDKPQETGMRQMAIAVKNTVRNISVVVSKVAQPNVPQPADRIFGYLQIDKANITDADISSVTIDFQVDKTWLNTFKIDKASVRLNRFADNAWTILDTKQTDETETHSVYRAESPGLSVFAISGKELPAAPTATPAATPTPAAAPVSLPQIVQDYGVWIVAFIVAAVILGYLFYHHKHARKLIAKYS